MRRRRPRPLAWIAAGAALLAGGWFAASLPPEPSPAQAGRDSKVLRGAFHVHTTRSDGQGSVDDVARAAAAAGLDFVVFTDHGDGTRAPDPPRYRHGVLCLDGVELSTDDGHYAVVGLPRAPYPLGGEVRDVVEDVARLGGFGVAAHPTSPKPGLAWRDRAAPFPGIEWLNADAEWRDESAAALARLPFDYLFRPAPALARTFDRPPALAMWDEATLRRAVVGLAGHDAHGGIGFGPEPGARRFLPLPSYEASFRSFTLRVRLDAPPSGDAADDARRLVQAISSGRVFTVVDALGLLERFELTVDGRPADGLELPAGESRRLGVRTEARPGTTLVVLRDGRPFVSARAAELEATLAPGPAVYRVEIRRDDAPGGPAVPWLVSNPVYIRAREPQPEQAAPVRWQPLDGGWQVERRGARAVLSEESGVVRLRYQLTPERARDPYVALARDLPAGLPPAATHLRLAVESDRPMRVSVQLRTSAGGGARRWRRSIYVEPGSPPAVVAIGELRAVGEGGVRPAPGQWRSLLLVIDAPHNPPGASGELAVGAVEVGAIKEDGRPQGRTIAAPTTRR